MLVMEEPNKEPNEEAAKGARYCHSFRATCIWLEQHARYRLEARLERIICTDYATDAPATV